MDVANGLLHFSIVAGSKDPRRWPDHLDEKRLKGFQRGYECVSSLIAGEVSAIPHLMVEALVAEAILPIAATGSFGKVRGFRFLQMIRRKASWLALHTDELVKVLQG